MDSHPKGPVRTVLVGLGYAGRVFHQNLIRAADSLSLVAIVSSKSRDECMELIGGHSTSIQVYSTLKDAFKGCLLELCVVATPNRAHSSVAQEAMELGLHVVIDKPFTCTVEEADSLLSAAATRGLVLSCFQNRQWDRYSNYVHARAIYLKPNNQRFFGYATCY